jgi:hypothetical protein
VRRGVATRVVLAVAARPSVWHVAAVQAKRLAPAGWWRRAPFLPLPDAGYIRFRSITQYGDADHALDADDVLNYLRWCQRQRRGRR